MAKLEIRYDEDRDVYELGGDVDGQFVAFHALEGGNVRGRVEQLKARQAASEQAGGAQADDTIPQPAT